MDNNQVNCLEPGDIISPNILTGFHYIPLKVNKEALHPKRENEIGEILRSLEYDEPPTWIKRFPEIIIIEIRKIFESISPPFENIRYRFSINRRLDEATFVGDDFNQKIPILTVKLTNEILSDNTGIVFIAHLKAFTNNDISSSSRFEFQIQLVDRKFLGDALNYHTPELMLIETWRIISVYDQLSVGIPAGSITVVPNEERIITIKHSSMSKVTEKDNFNITENITTDSVDKFTQNFDRISKQSGETTTVFKWSETSKMPGTQFIPTIDRSTSLDNTQKVSNTLDTTLKTVHEISLTQKKIREVKITRDYESVTTEDQSIERKITLKNNSNQCITYVYHYLDTIYKVHIDIVDIVLMYTGKTVDSPLQFFSLKNDFNKDLKSVLTKEQYIKDVRLLIDDNLRQRYSHLDMTEENNEGLILKSLTDNNDINTKIFSRQALFGSRRKNGALPVNLSATDIAIQTSNLHVVPHIAQFSLPQ